MRLFACFFAALAILAASAPARTAGMTTLTVTIWPKGQAAGVSRTWTLSCAPARGTLPRPGRACRALFANRTALRPPPRGEVCSAQYGGPQVASIVGVVRGQRVRTLLTRTNGCAIDRWSRLRALLPVPV